VLSPTRITLQYNEKIRPQPDRENAFAGASGGGDATGGERSLDPNHLISFAPPVNSSPIRCKSDRPRTSPLVWNLPKVAQRQSEADVKPHGCKSDDLGLRPEVVGAAVLADLATLGVQVMLWQVGRPLEATVRASGRGLDRAAGRSQMLAWRACPGHSRAPREPEPKPPQMLPF
jgi:hypothetical protein